ncbi:MAG: transposase, partial [Nitrospiraceae bacterium]|nr:transposase [Nitrospiraceae bacterium]
KACISLDNEIKEIACKEWEALPGNYPAVRLDEYVLMPNHLHAIIWIERARNNPALVLGNIIRGFKSKTAVRINKFRNITGIPVWQRNFYERIIRDDNELDAIRAYIKDNPLKWAEDEENPEIVKGITD